MNFLDIQPKYHDVDTTYNLRGYVDYVKGVLDGSIVTNEYIKLACKRTLDFDKRDDMYFDIEDVDMRIRFIWKMKHVTGQHYGHHFVLLDWQQFVVSQIFGWKWKHNNLRVTRNVFIMISRKNGKTCLAAALGLATIIGDKEFDAEIDMVANNSRQAAIAFNHTNNYAASLDPKEKIFKRYRSEIRIPALKSKIQVLSSESMGLDGYSSSVVIFDELHSQKDWKLYNVMKSSQGARQQPLMITLTTAGFLIGNMYPCYAQWETCIDILQGKKEDDTMFSAIYQLDQNDEWDDESVWKKCSPSLDQTVFKQFMRDEINAAKNNSSLEVGVRTKVLNQWCQSMDVWLPYDLLKTYSQPLTIESFSEHDFASYAYIGVDLSSVSDLSVISVMIYAEDKFWFKTYVFLPEDALHNGVNADKYRNWYNEGYIIVTPGNVQDYDYILNKIIEIGEILPISGIFYDSWNAVSFAVNAESQGLPMFPYSQALGNFNRPTKEFERLLKMGRVVIDYNPAVLWCFANSTLKADFNGNVKPIKADTKYGKIDAVISMMECLGGYFLTDTTQPDLTAL